MSIRFFSCANLQSTVKINQMKATNPREIRPKSIDNFIAEMRSVKALG